MLTAPLVAPYRLWSVSFSDASRLLRTWVVVTVISNACDAAT